jgi:hypothetical protein
MGIVRAKPPLWHDPADFPRKIRHGKTPEARRVQFQRADESGREDPAGIKNFQQDLLFILNVIKF